MHVARGLQGLPEGMLVKTKDKKLVMLSLSKHLSTVLDDGMLGLQDKVINYRPSDELCL